MTPNQKRLLDALRERGGVSDRYGRILAEGKSYPAETVLWSFHHGWISSDGERVTLTELGRREIEKELAEE